MVARLIFARMSALCAAPTQTKMTSIGPGTSTPKQKARFVSWNVESFNQLLYDWHGRIQGGQTGAHAFFNFQKQTFFGGGFDERYEKDYEEEFGAKRAPHQNGAFFGEPTRSTFNEVFVHRRRHDTQQDLFDAVFCVLRIRRDSITILAAGPNIRA